MKRRLVVAFALVVLLAISPVAAAPEFTASIVELSPAIPTSGSTIRLGLQIENPSATDIKNLHVRFMLSTAPLVGRSQIEPIARGKLLPTYRLLPDLVVSGLDLTSGASTTLPLTTSPRALGLDEGRPGVYTFGVLVDADGAESVRAMTFLPWLVNVGNAKPLGVVPVMTLSAKPQRKTDGTFLSADLVQSLLPDGRLRMQLDAMGSINGTTWLIDPETVEAVQALSEGARIADGDAVRATSNEEMSAAKQWLADLRTVSAQSPIYAIPAGDMDVRAAVRFGHQSLVVEALRSAGARVGAVLGINAVPTAIQMYGGSIGSNSWRFLRGLDVATVFVSDAAYPARQQQYTPSTPMTIPDFGAVFVLDQAASNVLARPGNGFLQRQELAAQLAMTYLEQPHKQRVVAVAIPQTWSPSRLAQIPALLTAPWINRTSIETASGASEESRRTVVGKPTNRQRQQATALSQALVRELMLRKLTTDEGFRAGITRVVGGMSSRWFTGNLTRDDYTEPANEELAALAGAVRVVTRGDIVFGGEQGLVPVTIANGLPVSVDVVLRASGLPSVRVAPEPATTLQLRPGKRVSVEIPTRVTGSGVAYLQLWLESAEGSVISDTIILDIRSAAYARVAGYLVAAAFSALLLLVAVNTVRRVRVRRAGSEHRR